MPSVKTRNIKALKRLKVDRLVEAIVGKGVRTGSGHWLRECNLRRAITESLWAHNWAVHWRQEPILLNGYYWSVHWVLRVIRGRFNLQYQLEFDKVGGNLVLAVFKPYAKRKSQAH